MRCSKISKFHAVILTTALMLVVLFFNSLPAYAYVWETDPFTVYEMSVSQIFEDIDLDPGTNGGSYYVGGFSQPTYGFNKADLYADGYLMNKYTYDEFKTYEFQNNSENIYFYTLIPGPYTFMAKLYDVDNYDGPPVKDLLIQ